MNRIVNVLLFAGIIAFMASCGGGSNSKVSKAASHPFAGTFVTEEGVIFTLNNDSTTHIQFDNGAEYESTWKIVSEDGEEWANIEFSGNQTYYYLKNGKIYRDRMNMDHDRFGSIVTYQD